MLEDPIWCRLVHFIFYSIKRKRTNLKCDTISEYGPLTSDDVLLEKKKNHRKRSPDCTSFLTKNGKKKKSNNNNHLIKSFLYSLRNLLRCNPKKKKFILNTFCKKWLLQPSRNIQCPCRDLIKTDTWYLSLTNSCMSDHRVPELIDDWFFLADAPPLNLPWPLEGFPEDWWPPWS